MPYYNRKNPRLHDYNYSENGAYFITICTQEKKHLFSRIVDSTANLPECELTDYGRIVQSVLSLLPKRFPITVERYVIMPNHIHLLVMIQDMDRVRAIRESPLQGRSMISNVVGYLKMNASKEIHRMGGPSQIWQRSFHDHIIRDRKDFEKIWMYIEDNPRRWKEDCFYIP